MRLRLMLTLALLVSACGSTVTTGPPDTTGSAVNIDLTSWTHLAATPALAPSEGWDRGFVISPFVLALEDGYHMWYTGGESLAAPDSIAIGYATSVDGIEWQRREAPVLRGTDGPWDSGGVGNPVVLKRGEVFHLWYGGGGTSPDEWEIGHATSTDGVSWETADAPVLTRDQVGAWSRDVLGPGTVVFEDELFKMWFYGGTGSVAPGTAATRSGIGYGTSPDGISWDVRSDPVLFVSEDGWDANYVIAPSVVRIGDEYHLFYSGWTEGGKQSIGHAVSSDGVSWERSGIVLDPPLWTNEIVYPSVVVEEQRALMWFQGWQGFSASVGVASTG